MTDLALTPFETKALEWLLEGEDPILQALRQQLARARVKIRKYTGVGFYTYFEIPQEIKPLHELFGVKSRFAFGDVVAEIGAPQQKVGFLLWITDGYIDFLEAYTYGDEKWPDEIHDFRFHRIGVSRDLNALRRTWQM